MGTETFGGAISAARKAKGLSQKELAERIKREDGEPISPQYLNDIEHDRRSPSSEHLVMQFSKVLGLDAEYLAFLADRWPASLRRAVRSQQDFSAAVAVFRKSLSKTG
jgi:transcriptional regulator with XRE-family HTH domain